MMLQRNQYRDCICCIVLCFTKVDKQKGSTYEFRIKVPNVCLPCSGLTFPVAVPVMHALQRIDANQIVT